MENSISTFCKTLAPFFHHLQSSSQALTESLKRRPLPLDSAASSFLQRMDRRVSSASTDLNLLESMAFGTVSFEELLGHCSEVYKKNQSYISALENHLKRFGYVPENQVEDDDGDLVVDSKFQSPETGLNRLALTCGSVSAGGSVMKRLEEDPLFENSMSLQNLGLSDACLATLASEAKDEYAKPKIFSGSLSIYDEGETIEKKGVKGNSVDDYMLDGDTARTLIDISNDDYDKLPSYMKSLASWEDLKEAVVRMNSELLKRAKAAKGNKTFDQKDLESLGLGPKGKSYLLLLIRMKRLTVETDSGSIVYRAIGNHRTLM